MFNHFPCRNNFLPSLLRLHTSKLNEEPNLSKTPINQHCDKFDEHRHRKANVNEDDDDEDDDDDDEDDDDRPVKGKRSVTKLAD